MTTPLKHAEVLRAIADGKRIQRKIIDASIDMWEHIEASAALTSIAGYSFNYEFRIAPDTIKIGKREVQMPSNGNVVVRIALARVFNKAHESEVFCFPTESAARAFYDALVEVAKGES